jgi:predicted site-specific integrase-resolvase
MKLSHWAKLKGISYLTAWRWFNQNQLPVKATKMPSGTIIVESEPLNNSNKKTYTYSRVSSHDKKEDLERQVKRCLDFCAINGWPVEKSFKEISSGMNDHRKQLTTLLNLNPSRIVVEHKDRLTRFGFGYFEILLPMLGCELVVINRDSEEQSDLIKDLVAIITSFCCRLYGMRRGLNKAKECKKVVSK